MELDLPQPIGSPDMKSSISHTTENSSGTFSAAVGEQRYGDTPTLTQAGGSRVSALTLGRMQQLSLRKLKGQGGMEHTSPCRVPFVLVLFFLRGIDLEKDICAQLNSQLHISVLSPEMNRLQWCELLQ